MKSYEKTFSQCELCNQEYPTEQEAYFCEEICKESHELEQKIIEIELAEQKARDLRKKFNEENRTALAPVVESVSYQMVTKDGETKYYKNGKECTEDDIPANAFDGSQFTIDFDKPFRILDNLIDNIFNW